jgi:hypothetical protein
VDNRDEVEKKGFSCLFVVFDASHRGFYDNSWFVPHEIHDLFYRYKAVDKSGGIIGA